MSKTLCCTAALAVLLAAFSSAWAAPQVTPAAAAFAGPEIESTAKGPPGDRVVVVSKQINEFIYDIGAENQVVARDRTAVYPPAILKKTSVGYHRALSADGIISMHPSVFLTDGSAGPAPVIEQLTKVGIPIKVIKPGKSMADAQALMLEVGRYFGREPQARAVVAAWQANMAKVMEASKLWANEPRPRVVMIHFGQIINNFLAVTGGPSNQIIEWAGGNNVLAGQGGMARFTPELMANAQPDAIIANDIAYDKFGSPQGFTQLPGVALTPAGKNQHIYRITEQESIYYGPRTPAAILKLARDFHPAVFAEHRELVALYKQLVKS